MKKKIVLALAMALLLACVFVISASAAECIDGIYYTFSGTEATVSSDNQKSCEVETVVIPEKVTFGNAEYTVTAIAARAFGSSNNGNGNGKIKSVTVPSTITSIGDYAFSNCTALTAVYSKSPIIGYRMFYHCDELTTIKLENTVEIGAAAFNNASLSKVSSLELPEGLTTIGEYAFPRMSITSLVIPSSVVSIDRYAFQDCESLEKVVVLGSTMGTSMFYSCASLRTLVLTESFESFGDSALQAVPTDSFTTYYTGTDYQRVITACSNSTRITKAGTTAYADYQSGNYTAKDYMLIYDCNICTVGFDGQHAMSGSPREQFNSFVDDITFTDTCTRQGCGKETIAKTIEPLFACLGYSSPENGRDGIAIGYTINVEAVKEYEKASGKTLKYGVFAALKDKLGDSYIFDEDGNAVANSVVAEVSSNDYVAVEFKITGFTDEYKDTKLAMGVYVITADKSADDDTTEIKPEYFYLQVGSPNANEKYEFISYNEVAAGKKTEA
ncbi:MAG: leucine-rich repeat domain-containing protein [Clostridia bacterium]|nr:leucine-rich repeat domain-containing protein [Clostridia bacterium]